MLQRSIRGIEKKPLPHLLATTNLILHDVEVPQIVHDNALTRRPYKDYDEADQVDVILTNPPFGGMEEPGVEQNFPQQFQTKETADLFLAMIVKLLKDKGGKGAIVLPDGSLFGEGIKTRPERAFACHVQPAYRRAPAQRRVQPVHGHQYQSAVLYQRRTDEGGLVF